MSDVSDQAAPHPASEGWSQRESSPLFRQIGTLWEKWHDNQLVLGLDCTPQTLNRTGRMHGGAISAFCDTALGATLRAELNRTSASTPRGFTTIQLNVQYIGGVQLGDFVEARCRIIRQTRSLAFVDGVLTVSGEPVAAVQSVFKFVRATS